MIIGAYHIFGKRKNTSKVNNLENRVRIWELRRFVREKFLKSILVTVVRLMPDKVEALVENRKLIGGLEMSMSKDILQFLTGDKKFVHDSETTYKRDMIETKTKMIGINVSIPPHIFLNLVQTRL